MNKPARAVLGWLGRDHWSVT